jgi:multiple sugar transport system substrate-binding protein
MTTRVAWLAIVALIAGACGTSASPSVSPGGSAASQPPVSAAPGPKALLRWYCCLGTGEDPTQVPTEEKVAADWSASQDLGDLKIEIVTYDAARATLSTQIASGNSPDIVGPVGLGGLASFEGQWLDLTPYIAKTGFDLGQFPDEAVQTFNVGAQGQVGIPFAIYPSMVWYKRDMFDEAGLEYPPHEYGATYKWPDGREVEWNYDTVKELALKLTVDESGKDATEAGFDPESIVQYGFEPQRDDLRGLGAYWGPGSLAAADGTTVEIPAAWQDAWKYFYDGMWKDHFIMTGPVAESEDFSGGGYTFFSGRVAMSLNFLWTTYGVADAGTDWDLAAIPSHNGKVTSPLNTDTFGIHKETKSPDAAFDALTYLHEEASDTLLQLYGAMPARPERQDAFFETLAQTEGFPDEVDWQVVKDSAQYADKPNFEAPVPKYNETINTLVKYRTKWVATPGLNMDTEIEALRAELQAIWDS